MVGAALHRPTLGRFHNRFQRGVSVALVALIFRPAKEVFTVDERARRIGLNEAVFREINERIEELAAGFKVGEGLDLICECGDASCVSRIKMGNKEYEALRSDATIRSDATTFAVVSGHEIPDVEEIVERHKTYDVVRKTGSDPQKMAEATDPR